MKRFIAILMSCSLALAMGAFAQQPVEQQSPTTTQQGEKPPSAKEARHAAKQEKRQERAGTHANATGQTGQTGQQNVAGSPETTPKAHTGRKGKGKESQSTDANANANVSPSASAAASTDLQGKKGRKGRHAEERAAKNAVSPTPANASVQSPSPAATQSVSPAAAQATSPSQANTANAQVNKQGGKGKKLDPQTIQTIKTQHANFRAQPKPDKVPAVTFNQNYRISGAEQWQGPQYEVFRTYHPEYHDQGWYHSRYNRVELIGGGYYYWNQGYWYPAWGYNPSAQYYAYDGPIYVGSRAEPPDRVIADVQAVLQQQGYYRGEVDGLLGPLTREALTAYQADNGLYTTAVIDEPTLSSLGMG